MTDNKLLKVYAEHFLRRCEVKSTLLLAGILILTSCTTSRGFNRVALKEELKEKTELNPAEINQATAGKAKLSKPYKVGIYFQDPDPTTNDRLAWSWSDADKKKILNIVEKFKTTGDISHAFIISSSLVSSKDVKSLRQVAAKQGADALIVISAINDLDQYNTPGAWSYALLLPTLFVPASVSDILFISKAVMWDTKYDFSYLTAESEVLINKKYPAVFRQDAKSLLEAKEDAITGLQKELIKRMNNVHQKKN